VSNLIRNCEEKLAEKLGRSHCILTGRGTTALWCAYNLTPKKRPKILIPAMVCLSPVFSVYYADCIPVFADVLERDATINPQAVRKLLEEDPEIGAVLAVHLFGFPADMRELNSVCRAHDVILIEDLAQAFGGIDHNGELFGAKGDVSIVSFGHTKILDVGGGGAILTDSDEMASQIRSLYTGLKVPKSDKAELAAQYRTLYYSIWECSKKNSKFLKLFDVFPELFRDLYFSKASESLADKINVAIERLDDEVSNRRRLDCLYREYLGKIPGVTLFNPTGPGVPWRFSFRMDSKNRDLVLDRIRAQGYDASSWYPCIPEWTTPGRAQGKRNFPVAQCLEDEIINLWVSQDYSKEKVKSIANIIHETAG
jgi:dTDP-4-amino-4,6-dideoxygalactose transaminase